MTALAGSHKRKASQHNWQDNIDIVPQETTMRIFKIFIGEIMLTTTSDSGCCATMEFLWNTAKYTTGASLGALLAGALVGWGIGSAVAGHSSPCIDKPNSRAVDLCAMGSPQAGEGALGAGLISGTFAGFFAVRHAYHKGVARRYELGFCEGLRDSISVLTSCCNN